MMSATLEERPVTARKLAAQFDIALSSVYRMAKENIIPYLRVGPKQGSVRFYPTAVRAALERRKQTEE